MKAQRTHIDLFSGLGGFALAAARNGVRTIQFCEIDQRCRDFLARVWPGVAIHDDVRSLGVADAGCIECREDESGRGPDWGAAAGGAGAPIWLLTAGVPCQPASRAGKQRGSADDRWLWPEALRLLRHYQPTWALFENPPGIGDVGLAGILAEVEAEGYEVRVHGVPACAVGAPHRRERYWIVAHTSQAGRERADAEPRADGLCAEHREGMGDAAEVRGRSGLCDCQPQGERRDKPANAGHWADFVWLPCADGKLRRAPDDAFGLVDGLHRSVLGGLGNSIVPQVAEVLIAAMIQAEDEA